jgi:REP element-mobilizing transposase RayT
MGRERDSENTGGRSDLRVGPEFDSSQEGRTDLGVGSESWAGTFPTRIDDFTQYRRHLPHWRISGSTYWVTWRLHPIYNELPPGARTIVAETLRHFDGARYTLTAFVVMDNHVHVIVAPAEGRKLEKIVQVWKSYSAYRINRELGIPGRIWQGEYFDRIIRSEEELHEKIIYTLNNPKKRWPEVETHDWLYCVFLSGSESWSDTKVRPTDSQNDPESQAPTGSQE